MVRTADDLARVLIELGLVETEDCRAAQQTASGSDALGFANELIATGKLTGYQAFIALRQDPRYLVLGNYEILDFIAGGGMGEVFRARHRTMYREVALKIIHTQRLNSQLARQRFNREIRAAGRLNHENIVIAHDAGETDGRTFLVMELLEGHDLQRFVKEHGPMALKQALNVTLKAASGLGYIHDQGMVHRDVKPSNLMICNNDDIKLLDVGLALLDSDDPAGTALTASGVVMGTAEYMSPEQALAPSDVDNRADIYSLGCTLHYLLTGSPVYSGRPFEMLLAHREQPAPTLRDAGVQCPDLAERVFAKMLAKSPEDRYANVEGLLLDLDELLDTLSNPPEPAPPESAHISDMKFELVPAGDSWIGIDSEADWGAPKTHPPHQVTISNDLLFSRFPVRQIEYQRVMGTNPSSRSRNANCPVESVSWFEAIRFANKLSDLDGLPRFYSVKGTEIEVLSGTGYRLPTEAEWEHACRAGTTTTWHFGEDSEMLRHYAWTYENADGQLQQVGQKIPNQLGIYDLYGNVWEWCWDWYDEAYYGYGPSDDPLGPRYGTERSIRGGSFHQGASSGNSSSRSGIRPIERSSMVGFRIVRTAKKEG